VIGEGVPARLLEALRREGLDTVEGAFAYGSGEDLAKAGLGGRRRTRLEVTDGDGRTHALYLKRYGPGVAGALRRWARQGRRGSAAGIEFENIRRARAAGVPTMQPVLCGEDPCPIGAKRSYLIVTSVPGEAMERCFEAFFRSHAGDGEVRAVTVKLARLVRRLHDTGHAHRDLYASHVFLDESAGGTGLYLIDLARMFPARLRRSRWFARDLAQLKYSMPAAWVAAFWRALLAEYLPGVSPAAIRRLDEAVDRKVAGIRARAERRRKRSRAGREL
jgi:tRNA A-37 threonylcarbamoyl transferase component Bud32